MGISNPVVGYSGYSATDDVLQTDPTVYVTGSTSYELLFSGKIIEDIAAYSKLRFKATMKDDNNNAGTTSCQLRIDGSAVATVSEAGAVYVTDSEDFTVPNDVRRGDIIDIYGKKSFAGSGSIKDVSICGARSPVIYD
jgi:hypothetical protein